MENTTEAKPTFRQKVLATLSVDTQKKIAQAHIDLYERRISSGSAMVRVSECSQYKEIWKDGLAELNAGRPLTAQATAELLDYIYTGAFEQLTLEEMQKIGDLLSSDEDVDEEA